MLRILNLRLWPFWLKITVMLSVVLLSALLLLVSAFEIQAREEADSRLRDYFVRPLRGVSGWKLSLKMPSVRSPKNRRRHLRNRLLSLLQLNDTPSGADIGRVRSEDC